MSRKGKLPIIIPEKVKVTVADRLVKVEGEKGKLEYRVNESMEVSVKDNKVVVQPKGKNGSEEKDSKAIHGLTRVLIANMIHGVSQGYVCKLEIVGVGYKALKKGEGLEINVGLSYPVTINPQPGISLSTEGNNTIVVSGIDKQKVGQMGADIRKIRPPEPYKGKGIRYKGEHIKRKAGKAGVATGEAK
jgi:large subunit ribosomal protein L6